MTAESDGADAAAANGDASEAPSPAPPPAASASASAAPKSSGAAAAAPAAAGAPAASSSSSSSSSSSPSPSPSSSVTPPMNRSVTGAAGVSRGVGNKGGSGGGRSGGGSGGGEGGTAPSSREQAQLTKLRDANAKYKSLLKMAKERIQAQEEELEKLRVEARRTREDLANEKVRNAELMASNEAMAMSAAEAGGGGGGGVGGAGIGGGDGPDGMGRGMNGDAGQTVIVKVCQRVKVEAPDGEYEANNRRGRRSGPGPTGESDSDNDDNDVDDASSSAAYPTHVIWALVEYETYNPDGVDNPSAPPPRRFQRWRRFETESDLSDHVRRETGEPIVVPPYSLSPAQSARIEEESRRAVADVSEEFRRFRVRSEVARKQADATVRALHNSNVQTTRRRIEGQDLEVELAQARTDHAQLSALRAEMAEQEGRWKEAYDTLLAENGALKSSGAEALLAAQWRQRYETCLREKEDAETRLDMEREKTGALSDMRKKADAGKYEMKYRDLKESFRLYRKKAKEIFEAQQRGVEAGGIQAGLLSLTDHGTEEAKLTYLRNLMVNYLSSDPAVREHMEGAIGTVLKFSRDDFQKIEQIKEKNESWFG